MNELWRELLALLIGALVSVAIEWLRRVQARYPAPGAAAPPPPPPAPPAADP